MDNDKNNNQCENYLEFVETIPSGFEFPSGIKTYPSIGGKVLEMIKGSEKSIKVISFYYRLRQGSLGNNYGTQIYKELILAAKRGVHIKFIANVCGQWRTNEDIFDLKKLFPKNVECKFIDMSNKTEGYIGGICHTKACIIDDSTFYVGSANMGWRAYNENVNTGFVGGRGSNLTSILSNIFEVCWNINSTDDMARISQKLSPQSELTGYLPIRLSTSPDIISHATTTLKDKDALLEVINTARKTLNIGSYVFTPYGRWSQPCYNDDSIENAIVNAATLRNVQIQILLDQICVQYPDKTNFFRRLMKLPGTMIKIFYGKRHMSSISVPYTKLLHIKTVSSESRVWNGTNNIDPSYFLCTTGIGVNINATDSAYSKQIMPLVDSVNDHFLRYWKSKYSSTLNEHLLVRLEELFE